jgi:PAS domain S-box-containing protein
MTFKHHWLARYVFAVAAVGAGLLLRLALTAWVGPGLPTYITFYPAVMAVALLAGIGPGLVATAVTVVAVDYWIVTPYVFGTESLVDAVGLALFSLMGVFMSITAELYRGARLKAAAYDQELALREGREEIRRQREWLRVTLTSIGDAVLATDTAGLITFLNPVAESLTGWPEQKALGQSVPNVFRIINEETRVPGEDIVARVLREGRAVALANHTSLVTPDGREVPIEDSAAPIKDSAGTVSGVVLVFHDVTEKRRAAAALRESEQQFRTLAESIPNLAWWANSDGYITWYNRRWYEYTGTTPDQMEGWGWQSVHDPQILPAVLERWKASIAAAQPFNMTFPLRGADGVFRPFLTRVMPLKDAQGRVQQWFGTNTDVSEQILAEETEQRLNAELRQRVAELQAANEEVQASRRAALSLAEDATEARKEAERVNADLQKASESLGASRHAALNLMDDAVRARRQAEQASAEQRRTAEQRRLALEAADLGAWDYHFQTGDVFWDERCREMWGIPRSDHVDYPTAINRIHPDDRAGVDAAVKEALAVRDGGHYHREFRVVWPDGSVHWIASHGQVYFQGEGDERKPIRFIGANLEITLQKEAQAALQAANEELEQRVAARTAELRTKSLYARSLLEASLDPLVTISPDGEITDVNRATEEVTGITRERLVGTKISAYFTEPVKAEAGYQQVLAEGLVRDYPLTIRHASGRTTDVLYHATVYRDEAGTVQGVFAAARDITERKQAERRRDFTSALLGLFAQKNSARDYLDSVLGVIRQWSGCQALGIRILDEHGEIPYETCAGFEPEFVELESRLSLKRDNCCCIRAISQAFEEPDRALLTPGGSYRCDDAIAYADSLPPEKRARFRGTCMKFGFASLAVIPIRYRDAVIGAVHLADHRPGQFPLPAVEFLEAMTPLIGEAMHRFQTEAELARHRDQLEVLVRERTAELTDANARLQQTAEDLKRSNRDLEQFAYVASHDLQEPLRAVGGYVKLLERRLSGTLDARAREFIAGAFEGAVRMERLIHDLLAFSRVGTRGGDFVATDLEGVLQRTLANLHASIESAQATVTHDTLPTVTVDGTQIMQVFQNLIGNALKFRGEAPPRIHVGAQRQEGRWVFSVRDNGIGIEPQYFEKIFQLFQRLHTRKQYAGTGIGLAICKRIIERHGGTIWVESQPGQGTTFSFTIPN